MSLVFLGTLIGELSCLNTPLFDLEKRELLWLSTLVVIPWTFLGAFIGSTHFSTSQGGVWSPFLFAFVLVSIHILLLKNFKS